jgi:hypothetical protein
MNKQYVGIIVAAVAVLILWGNRFSYSEFKNDGLTLPLRTSRLSGKSELFNGTSWINLEGNSSSGGNSESRSRFQLKQEDVNKLKGNAIPDLVSSDGVSRTVVLNCNLYNGSQFAVSDVTIRIRLEASIPKNAIERDYRVSPENGVAKSLANSVFKVDTGLDFGTNSWTWGVVAATGIK